MRCCDGGPIRGRASACDGCFAHLDCTAATLTLCTAELFCHGTLRFVGCNCARGAPCDLWLKATAALLLLNVVLCVFAFAAECFGWPVGWPQLSCCCACCACWLQGAWAWCRAGIFSCEWPHACGKAVACPVYAAAVCCVLLRCSNSSASSAA